MPSASSTKPSPRARRRMPVSPETPRPPHSRARELEESKPTGLLGSCAGDPDASVARRECAQDTSWGQAPALRSRPQRADPHSARPRAMPGPSPARPRPHLAPTAAAQVLARGHAPGAHPLCRVSAQWPLPGPQALRSALQKGGEWTTGRRLWRSWGRGPAGSAGGGERGGRNPRAQHPQLRRGLSAVRASGIYPWDPLYVLRLGEG